MGSFIVIAFIIWLTVKAESETQEENSWISQQSINEMTNEDSPQCHQIPISKQTKNMMSLKDLCILKQRWYEIPEIKFASNNFSQTRREYVYDNVLLDTLEERLSVASDEKHYDCLFGQRKAMRPYPGNCYSKKFHFENVQHDNFWAQISGEFMYTFDRVLRNDFLRERAENQFWYLILYLKTLVTLIDNPIKILEIEKRLDLIEYKIHRMTIHYSAHRVKQAAKIAFEALLN